MTLNSVRAAMQGRHRNAIRKTVGERIFDALNAVFLGVLAFSFLYPFWYLLVLSLSDAWSGTSQVFFWPKAFSLESYADVLDSKYIYLGFLWSTIRTVLGTVIAVFLGYNLAYCLSKKDFPNRGFWTSILIFTMFFSGGMVPEYLLVKNLGMINSVWSLVLPGAISAYNITIMRNYLMTLPDSLEESARIDGANDILILYRIVLPLSLPIIATVALWTAVGHWNAWFDAMIYITKTDKQVLQITLRRIVLEGTNTMAQGNGVEYNTNIASDTIKAATVMIATIPILCVYPFIQKYFVKGVMIGSLKG